MAKIDSSFLDLTYLDTLATGKTFVHRLDARAKLLSTIFYVIVVVSFGKYEVSRLMPFFLFPVALVAAADLPLSYLMKKVLLAAPFAFFIGIFNPLMDREVLAHLGPLAISGGWVSFFSILIRFVLTVSAALILVATTGFNAVCMSIEKLGAPSVFAVQLLFLYRYLFVLTEEAARMVRARALRSFDGRGTGIRVYGFMMGQLFLRTFDRAQRIHLAMLCRGFNGEIRFLQPSGFGRADTFFLLGWSSLFVLMRLYDFPRLVGTTITELLR